MTSLQEASQRTGPAPSWAEVTASGPVPSRPSLLKEVLPKVQNKQGPALKQQQSTEDTEVQQPHQQHRQVDEEGFTVVSRKKTNRRNELTGSSTETKLKGVAAPLRKVSLFIGRLDPSTTSEDVALHVKNIVGSGSTIEAVEIPHCHDKYGYRGFKVCVPAEDVGRVLQADKWPKHVTVRKFFPPKVGATNVKLTRSTSAGDVTGSSKK